MTTVDVELGAGRGDQLRLAAADERRGIGEAPFLRRAQHDVGAGGSRQTGQFVEKDVRVDRPRGASDQSDDRCAFLGRLVRSSAAFAHACKRF